MDIFLGRCGNKPTTTKPPLRDKTKMKTKTTKPLILALATTISAAFPAAAQLSDTLIYTPLNINLVIPENGPPASEFVPAFAPVPNLQDQAVLLFEPGGTAGVRVLSDALWVQNGFLYFESDVNDVLPNFPASIPVVGTLDETGTLQDLGVLMISPTGAPAFNPGTLLVASDVETPEPSTLAMLGIGGIIGAASFLRRRKV